MHLYQWLHQPLPVQDRPLTPLWHSAFDSKGLVLPIRDMQVLERGEQGLQEVRQFQQTHSDRARWSELAVISRRYQFMYPRLLPMIDVRPYVVKLSGLPPFANLSESAARRSAPRGRIFRDYPYAN